MSDKLTDEDLLDALDWISRRCPESLENDMDQPHRVHVEAAWDAGQCARAAMTRYQARKGVAAKAGPSNRMSHCSVHGVDYAKASGCSLCHKARKGER